MKNLLLIGSDKYMTIDEVIKLISKTQNKSLTPLQEQILRQAWQGQTYTDMANVLHYQEAYIKNIASQLWQDLSELFSESITKTNFCSKFKTRVLTSQQYKELQEAQNQGLINFSVEFPTGPVPLHSSFYIERSPLEDLIYAELHKPGSFIRIKAPAQMGKSSLIMRVMQYGINLGYKTISIDFKEADQSIFLNLGQFLRWLCANITQQLELLSSVEEHWDEEIGCKTNCNFYLSNVILKKLDSPLVLALHDLHTIFEYPSIAQDFLSLIRLWHEKSRQAKNWEKLRLIVVHTTEVYVPLQINQSPFNVGLPITLPEFTPEQVKELALRHGLNWKDQQGSKKIKALMDMVGGHPHLIRLALYNLVSHSKQDLEQLLNQAATPAGIYQHHLQSLAAILQANSELAMALKQVIMNSHQAQLEATTLHKLISLGLVKLDGANVVPRCQLYRLYFKNQPFNSENLELEKLKIELEKLKLLAITDQVTQIYNRHYFDQVLDKEWRRLSRTMLPLSLILCDVDFFKAYNDTYGHPAGDACLRRVAQTIQNCVHRPSDVVAKFGGEEFAIILPETDANGAMLVAEKIRRSVKSLGIRRGKLDQENSTEAPLTISIGVACIIPSHHNDSQALIDAADIALYDSKFHGRDQVTISSNLDFRF